MRRGEWCILALLYGPSKVFSCWSSTHLCGTDCGRGEASDTNNLTSLLQTTVGKKRKRANCGDFIGGRGAPYALELSTHSGIFCCRSSCQRRLKAALGKLLSVLCLRVISLLFRPGWNPWNPSIFFGRGAALET